MKKLNINQEFFSKTFWEIIFKNSDFLLAVNAQNLLVNSFDLDKYRAEADYNTGSITAGTFLSLVALSAYFSPRTVVEVGTFIGRSAYAIAKGADLTGGAVKIYTCDFSNAISLNLPTNSEVIQYQKTSSTSMLEDLVKAGVKSDFLHYDGRIQPEDIKLLSLVSHETTVYLFDDFEGVEKGVSNYQTLKNSGLLKQYILVYPASVENYSAQFGSSKLAVAIPVKLLNLTAQ